MSKVQFTPLAEKDLNEHFDYISHDKPQAAVRFVQLIRERCDLLAGHPEIGQLRPEFSTGLYRSFSVSNFVIFFKPTDDGILVARIVRGQRDFKQLFDENQ